MNIISLEEFYKLYPELTGSTTIEAIYRSTTPNAHFLHNCNISFAKNNEKFYIFESNTAGHCYGTLMSTLRKQTRRSVLFGIQNTKDNQQFLNEIFNPKISIFRKYFERNEENLYLIKDKNNLNRMLFLDSSKGTPTNEAYILINLFLIIRNIIKSIRIYNTLRNKYKLSQVLATIISSHFLDYIDSYFLKENLVMPYFNNSEWGGFDYSIWTYEGTKKRFDFNTILTGDITNDLWIINDSARINSCWYSLKSESKDNPNYELNEFYKKYAKLNTSYNGWADANTHKKLPVKSKFINIQTHKEVPLNEYNTITSLSKSQYRIFISLDEFVKCVQELAVEN